VFLAEAIDQVGVGDALVVALVGPIGAGKTEWVRGLAEGLGVDSRCVASPTFVIASEYPGRRRLVHVDLYRLEDERAAEDVGFRDLLAAGSIVAVEWADRFPSLLPFDRIEVEIERSRSGATDEREIRIEATGPAAQKVVDAWTRIAAARTRCGEAASAVWE
jgi:tRNA threonylcarbamoyladenosine biosynthesis protein TsaE